jgi:hypothetical protein
MLLHCPTCHAQIEAGPLSPGATASCPVCQGVFEVPGEATPTSNLTAPPAKDSADTSEAAGSLVTTLGWAFLFMCLFALVGAGSGYLVFRFAQSRELRPAPVLTTPESDLDASLTWRQVGRWSGVGMGQTPPLRMTNRRWRIQWSAAPLMPENADNFAIHVCDLGGKQLQTPVSIVGGGGDMAYISAPPGRYKLEIFTFETRWEVTVEEPVAP